MKSYENRPNLIKAPWCENCRSRLYQRVQVSRVISPICNQNMMFKWGILRHSIKHQVKGKLYQKNIFFLLTQNQRATDSHEILAQKEKVSSRSVQNSVLNSICIYTFFNFYVIFSIECVFRSLLTDSICPYPFFITTTTLLQAPSFFSLGMIPFNLAP